jgi:hypothetical protein
MKERTENIEIILKNDPDILKLINEKMRSI